MINLSDSTPSPSTGSLNVAWQNDGSGNVSGSVPPFVASGGSHAPGLVPDPGATPGSTRFLREDATWQVPSGGGGGLAVGSNVYQGPQRLTNGGAIAGDFSYVVRIPGNCLTCLPQSFQLVMAFTAGTGVHIDKCQLFQSVLFANNQNVSWTHVADFTFSGLTSINQAFGGTPDQNNPFLITTDTLSQALDSTHDWYIVIYLDDDSGGSNYNATVGLATTPEGTMPTSSGFGSGDKTGSSTVPNGLLSADTTRGVVQLTLQS